MPGLNVAVVAAFAGALAAARSAGGEHGAGEQPPCRAAHGVVMSCIHRVVSCSCVIVAATARRHRALHGRARPGRRDRCRPRRRRRGPRRARSGARCSRAVPPTSSLTFLAAPGSSSRNSATASAIAGNRGRVGVGRSQALLGGLVGDVLGHELNAGSALDAGLRGIGRHVRVGRRAIGAAGREGEGGGAGSEQGRQGAGHLCFSVRLSIVRQQACGIARLVSLAEPPRIRTLGSQAA